MLPQVAHYIDITICPKCKGQIKIIAAIQDPKIINKILEHLFTILWCHMRTGLFQFAYFYRICLGTIVADVNIEPFKINHSEKK